jgi:hypothetical protein
LYNLGLVAHYQGQHAAAHAYLAESLAFRRQYGNTPEIARCLAALGEPAFTEAWNQGQASSLSDVTVPEPGKTTP